MKVTQVALSQATVRSLHCSVPVAILYKVIIKDHIKGQSLTLLYSHSSIIKQVTGYSDLMKFWQMGEE